MVPSWQQRDIRAYGIAAGVAAAGLSRRALCRPNNRLGGGRRRDNTESDEAEEEASELADLQHGWAGDDMTRYAQETTLTLMFLNPRRIKWGVEGPRQRGEIFEMAENTQADIIGLSDPGLKTGPGQRGRYNTHYQCGLFWRESLIEVGG